MKMFNLFGKKRDLDPKFNELIHFEEIMITKSVV